MNGKSDFLGLAPVMLRFSRLTDMETICVNILPLREIFFLGVALRECGVFEQSGPQRLLKLFFYVALPALILLSVSNLQLSVKRLFLKYSGFFLHGSTGYRICRQCCHLLYVAGGALTYLHSELRGDAISNIRLLDPLYG